VLESVFVFFITPPLHYSLFSVPEQAVSSCESSARPMTMRFTTLFTHSRKS